MSRETAIAAIEAGAELAMKKASEANAPKEKDGSFVVPKTVE